jgi:hypothetical protein
MVGAGLESEFSHIEVGGRGEITHLGRTHIDGAGRWVEFHGPDTFKVVGAIVFYSAAGDELHATFAGTLVTD